MSLGFAFAEEFHTKSLPHFQELTTRNIGVQDFEGIGPGENYLGLIKMNENSTVSVNFHETPISKLTSWSASFRFKKAADGSLTNGAKLAYFGLLCQPIRDMPQNIDVTASAGLMFIGDTNAFAAIDGTVAGFAGLQFYVPPSLGTYVPYSAAAAASTAASNAAAAAGNVANGAVDTLKSAGASAMTAASNAASVLADTASGAIGSAASGISNLTSNPAISKFSSALGFVNQVPSSGLLADKVANVTDSVKEMSSTVASLASSATGSILANVKSAAAVPGSIPNPLAGMSGAVSSPALQAAAVKVSAEITTISPSIPVPKISTTSGPFIQVSMSYVEGWIYVYVDGQEIRKFQPSAELLTALSNKSYVIGCSCENLRLQLDSIAFSGAIA